MKKIFSIIVMLVLCAEISGCAQNMSPNTYQASDVGKASKAVPGVIVAKRNINIDANSGVGGLAGAVAGGAAGSVIGGSTASNIIGAVGGAVLGGLAGNAIDKSVNHKQGIEYIIKLKDGSTVSVTQTEDMQLAIHQHVLIIYGKTTRIIPDTTV